MCHHVIVYRTVIWVSCMLINIPVISTLNTHVTIIVIGMRSNHLKHQ